jgi:hypothetical protein
VGALAAGDGEGTYRRDLFKAKKHLDQRKKRSTDEHAGADDFHIDEDLDLSDLGDGDDLDSAMSAAAEAVSKPAAPAIPAVAPSIAPAIPSIPSIAPAAPNNRISSSGIPAITPSLPVTGSVPALKPAGATGSNPAFKPAGATGAVPALKPAGATGSNPALKPAGATGTNPALKPAGATGTNPALKPAGATGSNPALKPVSRPLPPVGSDGGLNEQKIKAIYDAYVMAKKRCGEDTSKLSLDSVASTLKSQVPSLMKQHNAKSVEFKVVIKDGKAVLRALPKE